MVLRAYMEKHHVRFGIMAKKYRIVVLPTKIVAKKKKTQTKYIYFFLVVFRNDYGPNTQRGFHWEVFETRRGLH